ncbi:hypothetical protein [Clostridium sp. DL1XJH146]
MSGKVSKEMMTILLVNQQFEYMINIVEDEERHERELIDMIDEEKSSYIGSVVLGLNNAIF